MKRFICLSLVLLNFQAIAQVDKSMDNIELNDSQMVQCVFICARLDGIYSNPKTPEQRTGRAQVDRIFPAYTAFSQGYADRMKMSSEEMNLRKDAVLKLDIPTLVSSFKLCEANKRIKPYLK